MLDETIKHTRRIDTTIKKLHVLGMHWKALLLMRKNRGVPKLQNKLFAMSTNIQNKTGHVRKALKLSHLTQRN